MRTSGGTSSLFVAPIRVHEQPVDDLEGAFLDVLVRTVDRVTGLEPDDRLPPTLRELGSGFGRREPVGLEVRMDRQR